MENFCFWYFWKAFWEPSEVAASKETKESGLVRSAHGKLHRVETLHSSSVFLTMDALLSSLASGSWFPDSGRRDGHSGFWESEGKPCVWGESMRSVEWVVGLPYTIHAQQHEKKREKGRAWMRVINKIRSDRRMEHFEHSLWKLFSKWFNEDPKANKEQPIHLSLFSSFQSHFDSQC